MASLGLREWVALGALLAAVVIAITFVDPTSGGSSTSNGPSRVLTVSRSVTASPPQTLAQPGAWNVGFHDISADGASRLDTQVALEKLDIAFPGAPFAGLLDNSWKLTAEADLELAPGTYNFSLEHDCELRVRLNNVEVASSDDRPAASVVDISFTHAGGYASLKIECRDRTGPFVLRWKE
jgi:hypothetical protein